MFTAFMSIKNNEKDEKSKEIICLLQPGRTQKKPPILFSRGTLEYITSLIRFLASFFFFINRESFEPLTLNLFGIRKQSLYIPI